jgi:hypothetical protein
MPRSINAAMEQTVCRSDLPCGAMQCNADSVRWFDYAHDDSAFHWFGKEMPCCISLQYP